MTDLEIKFLHRLMARDAIVWAQRMGLPKASLGRAALGGHETAKVLAEWRAELRGAGPQQADRDYLNGKANENRTSGEHLPDNTSTTYSVAGTSQKEVPNSRSPDPAERSTFEQ